MIVASGGRLDGEQASALAIQHQFDFVAFRQAFDMLVAVAREAHLNFVLGVEREGVANGESAARAERELVEMLLLREVGRKGDGVAARGTCGAAEREAADFARGGNVALQQGRREIADGHVVETVAGLVAGQQRGDIDFERQQVADGVLVFGAVEAAEGVGAAGIGMRGGGAIERGFERGDDASGRCARRGAAVRRAACSAPRSLRTTFSQSSGCRLTLSTDAISSARPPAFTLALWHPAQ